MGNNLLVGMHHSLSYSFLFNGKWEENQVVVGSYPLLCTKVQLLTYPELSAVDNCTIQVYSRRKVEAKIITVLFTSIMTRSSGFKYSIRYSTGDGTDLDLPIAFRKGNGCVISSNLQFCFISSSINSISCFLVKLAECFPSCVVDALKNPKLKAAMLEEIKAVKKKRTWEIVDLPAGKHTVGCRLMYALKYNPCGTIQRYKPRLVATGFCFFG